MQSKMRRLEECRLKFRILALAGGTIVALVSMAAAADLELERSGVRQADSVVIAQAEGAVRPTGRCKLSGCAHEVCADENVITPCIWRPQFECYKTALCEVQSDGKCGWTTTRELETCLKNSRGPLSGNGNRGDASPPN
jgi:hypothetical protein